MDVFEELFESFEFSKRKISPKKGKMTLLP